jgi:DNA-binding NarL/FixJ family response regulator
MTRLLVVAGVKLYREGLAHVLAGRADLQVVGTAHDLVEALEVLQGVEAEVALVDVTQADAAERVRLFRCSVPYLKIVILALDDSEEDKLLACILAGASGYVPTGGSLEDLATTIQQVARGEMSCPPRITGRMAALLTSAPQAAEGGTGYLTQRERQVAQLITRGLSNKEIAQVLHLSIATVKHHCHHLLEKLAVHRRAEVMARLRGAFVSAVSLLTSLSATI